MRVRLHSPLDKILAPVRELDVPGPVPLSTVLQMLQEEAPGFACYGGFTPGSEQPYGLLAWRNQELLFLNDMLDPEDEVEMIPMVAGG